MTPTTKLATASPRGVRENSVCRIRADHSFHQREEERMWQYDGHGSPRISRGRRPAEREWRHALYAVSILASVRGDGRQSVAILNPFIFPWQWTMKILTFILSTSNWILGKKLLSIPAIQTFNSIDFTVTEKDPTRAFSWLKAPTNTFTFQTLLRHYAKQALAHGK